MPDSKELMARAEELNALKEYLEKEIIKMEIELHPNEYFNDSQLCGLIFRLSWLSGQELIDLHRKLSEDLKVFSSSNKSIPRKVKIKRLYVSNK